MSSLPKKTFESNKKSLTPNYQASVDLNDTQISTPLQDGFAVSNEPDVWVAAENETVADNTPNASHSYEGLPTENLVKIGDAAKILGISIDTVRRWVGNGKITSYRTPGGTRVFDKTALEEFLKNQFSTPAPSVEVTNFIGIREAATKMGVSIKTLRRWDQSGKLQAQRGENGERIYSTETIEQLTSTPTVVPPLTVAAPVASLINNNTISLPAWVVKTVAASTLVVTLLTGVITAGYLKAPNPTKTLLGMSSTSQRSSNEGSDNIAEYSLSGTRAESKGEILGTSISDNPVLSFAQATLGLILSPFNQLSQKVIQQTRPEIAKQLGFPEKEAQQDQKIAEISKQNEELLAQIEQNGLKVNELDSNFTSSLVALSSPTEDVSTTTFNLLSNSSFEANTSGQPTGWSYLNQSTVNNTYASGTSVRSGSTAVKIQPAESSGTGTATNFGIYQPSVSTAANHVYTLSVYVRNELDQTPTLRLTFWDRIHNTRALTQDFTLEAVKDWRRYSFTLDPPNQGVDGNGFYPMIEILNVNSGQAGNLYLDDIDLSEGFVNSFYDQENLKIGDGSIIIDSNGNFYPAIMRSGSLGTINYPFSTLYLTHASIDQDGNTNIDGTLTVAGNTNLRGNTSLSGDLAVDGGDITSASSTFNLLTSTVTALNIGTSATNISIGSATGTTTINNNLVITGTSSSASGLSLPDGSAATPALNFTNNTNAGLYRLGSNIIGLITNGSATSGITINAGNVGVGTTSPSYKLDVSGTLNASGATTLSSTLAVTSNTTLTGALTANDAVNLGDATSDDIAITGRITTSLIPKLTANVDLGSSSLKWNSIYAQTINTTGTNTSGQAAFTYDPADTSFPESSVFINPTTADANETLLGIGIAGVEKAGIDAEGDLILGYSSATAPVVSTPLAIYNHGTTQVFTVAETGATTISPTSTGTFLDFDLETEWTAGDLVNADWDSATTQTTALTGINLDFTNLTSVAGSTTYGLAINDLAAQTTSTEYAIYQEGTNWDYGIYAEDSVQFTAAGIASTPAQTLSGTWFTGGSATTTKPQLLIEPTGTTSTAWSTSGTGIGVNAASGFAGNLIDAQVAGASVFSIGKAGTITINQPSGSFLTGFDLKYNGISQLSSSYNGYVTTLGAFRAPAAGGFANSNTTGTGMFPDNYAIYMKNEANTVATFGGNQRPGGGTTLALTPPAQAGTGLSAEVPDFSIASHTDTLASGYATQRFSIFGQPTITAASALNISTQATTMTIAGAPIAAGSATIANAYALKIDTGTSVASGVTNAYGLYVDAPTGATNNYAATFATGNVGIGDTSPTNALTITGAASVSSYLQVGQETATTYSRFGAGTTGHTLSGADALLVTGAFEVDGAGYFDSTLDVASTLTANTFASSGATITGGTINGTVIGGVTPAAGTFTDLTVNGNTVLGNLNTADTLTGNLLTSAITSGATTQTVFSVAGTGFTTGELLDLTGTFAPADGSTNEAMDINITHTPTISADNFQSLNLTTTDGTALGNTVYNQQNTLTLTGNAAKTGIGVYSTVTSSSTTADTLYAGQFATSATGALSTGTRSVYGINSAPASTAASTGGTLNLYGSYLAPTSTLSNPGVTDTTANNVYGQYITTTATLAANCTTNCTTNQYGLYVANGTSSTNGTSTKYGLYVESPTGADTNYAAIFAGGNVGIGITSPTTKLELMGSTAPASIGTENVLTLSRSENGGVSYPNVAQFAVGRYQVGCCNPFTRLDINLKALGSSTRTGEVTVMSLQSNGNVGIATTAPDAALEINHATGDSLRLTYNDSNGSATNYTDFSLSSAGALTLTGSSATIADGATAEKTYLTLTPGTTTLTGPTGVTSLMETSVITGATIAATNATTVNRATGLSVAAPIDSTNATITTSAAITALDITSGAGTLTNLAGIYVEPMTGGATGNYGICFDCDGTWTSSTVAAGIQFGTDANAVSLYRSASDTLRTGDNLTVDLDLTVTGGDITGANGEGIDIGEASNGTISLLIDATSGLNVGSTGISSIGNVAHTIVNSSGALNIDSNSTGAINIGTGANAKTITIGNNTTTSALAFTSGTGSQTHTSSVVSTTGTSSAFVFNDAALTTGTLMYLQATALTTGNLLDINTGSSIFSISNTALTTSLPTNFTSSGDVAIAYDINFTNPTAAYIKSSASLYIQAGPSYANNDLVFQTFGTGTVLVDQSIATTGAPTAFKINSAAHTTLTASTEATDINFNLNRTVGFAAGAITTQRAIQISAPTYNIASGNTITNATTLALSGAPTVDASDTITTSAALRIGNTTSGGGTITSNYGLYIDAQTHGTADYGIYIADSDTASLWLGSDDGDQASGIVFGATRDTNLYRSAANTLRTDDSLSVNAQHILALSGEVVFNETQTDINLRVEGDNNANLLFLDAGLFTGVGQVSIGSASQGTATAFMVIDNPAISATADQNFYKLLIDNSAAVTIPTGTAALVASLAIDEPNITLTGTVTTAASLYVQAAPTEATNNYALFVDAGTSRFDGAMAYGAQQTFTDLDATPDVSAGTHFITNTSAVTITDFDAGAGTLQAGHIIFVESAGAITYDCNPFANLNCGGADIVTADKDLTSWIYDGTDWTLINFMDTTGNQTGADLAEWYVSHEDLQPGDVVSIIQSEDVVVTKSSGSYDQKALGIVTTNPGVILGEQEQHTFAIGLAGRVPTKVSTENGAINRGDYLTSSSIPGVAMKATRPGQVIGKALENYSGNGIGQVMTFINISFADPGNFLASLSLDSEGNLIIPKLKTAKLTLAAIPTTELSTDNSSVILTHLGGEGSQDSSTMSQNDNVFDIAGKIASLEQIIATQYEKVKTLEEKVATITNAPATPSANLADLRDHMSSQSAVIASLSAAIATSSSRLLVQDPDSGVAEAPQNDNTLNLTPPDLLLATGSATLANLTVTSEASFSAMLATYDVTVSNTFSSLGETTLGSTNIAGDLSVDGTLSITQGNTINSIGTLFIQSSALANNVDFFNNLVTIDNTGKLVAKTISATEYQAVAGTSVGTGTILSGVRSVEILTDIAKSTSRIFVTPTTETNLVLSVTTVVPGQQFTVSVPQNVTSNLTFNWWIVNESQ